MSAVLDNLPTLDRAVTREQIVRLQSEMAKLPQVELPTEHFFAGGMYARRMFAPAGTAIVGKVHKSEHFFIVAAGEIAVTTDEGVKTLRAGDVLRASPGTKRAGVAITDVIVLNIHRTNETDLDALEAELIEPEEAALFDAHNKLKSLEVKP